MLTHSIKTKLVILVVFIITIFIYSNQFQDEVVMVQSDVDNQFYLVRKLKDKQDAANMIAKIKQNINKLVNYLYEHKSEYPEYETYIDMLKTRIQNVSVKESSPSSRYTSYSVNKGEEIVFCIRSKKDYNKFHSMNLIMYVTIHELAHVGCPEIGHTELFKSIFAFLLQKAIDIGIYEYVDYSVNNEEYCGLTIKESII